MQATAIAVFMALFASFPVFGAIELCPNGELSAVAQHGATQAYFYLPLDPALNAAAATGVSVAGSEVFLDVTLGPGPGSPLPNPNCFFITALLPGSLEPGEYTVRWTVKRVVDCSAGTCESDRAVFTQPLSVAEPLVCTGDDAKFDVLPQPPVAGASIKALHATRNVMPYVLSEPTVTITGTQIEIRQTGTYSGPPPPPTIYCISTAATLGALAAGDYQVTWVLATPLGTETYKHSLSVFSVVAVPVFHASVLAGLAIVLGLIALRAVRY